MVGGVLATIQAKEVYEATGIKPFKGILNIPGQLDKRNQLIIDNLPLDYSILDEIEYKYPMNNAYYGYTTRGCIRKCPFCAVPKLEPVYNSYIPLRERIEETRKQYGDQKDLLLMDNNILASSEFDTIINDIVACGFGKDAIFIQPDLLALSIAHLRSTPVINERANIRKAQSLIMEFYQKLKGEESFEIYKIIFEKYKINKLLTTTKEHLLAAYDEIKDIYKKHFKPAPRHRYVDFNQGVDARLFTEENVKQLSRIAIRPLRIAFDNIKTEAQYTRAIEMSSKVGLKDFSNYLLYNFDDHPDDLYHRLRINVELCDRLNVSIYSFPMKYHPIRRTEDMDEDYSHNRDYIGKYWNRKYIRAIQAVLNSTKGKIGKGTSFFMKAFGENIEEYHKLLEMPETMIIYRYFFEWLGLENGGKKTAIEILGNDSICNASAHSWWKAFCTCKENVSSKEWEMALNIIHKNDFSKSYHTGNSYVDTLLGYYVSYRQAIIEPNTDLYKLKQVYDQNPLKELRRTQKSNKYIVMENVLLLEIKQLYDSLVAAPYGEYVHGYGTQKPNGFKYKSNAQTLFNKVVELNEKCRPSYIDEQTIFQLSHTLEKEVEHVVGTYEEAIKPNAAQKRWQELDDKMNRATRQIHLDIYSLLSYIEETSHE